MKLSADQLAETIEVARDYLTASAHDPLAVARLARDFAEAIVQLGDSCVVGLPCEKHYGSVHGQEAEELRAGVEQIIPSMEAAHDDDALFVLRETRKALICLLDRIDARDSLAFREADDDDEDAEDDSEEDGDEAYRQRCAARRAFFAGRSVGDKVSWGIKRSGVIQKIEEEHVTIRDDGWSADPPLVVYTPPFVERFRIDYMLNLALVEEAPKG